MINIITLNNIFENGKNRENHRPFLRFNSKEKIKSGLRKTNKHSPSAGFFVLAPDFLYGDPDKVKEDAKSVIATLKSKGVNSIGAAGFCWGGNVAVKLASSSNDIQAAVILHPGPLTIDEIKGKDSNCCSGS
uniref:Dienelactone hydrolase domain-containing protein n=1 Tax=Salix viminalis TaxID=40686 RepID=A0A6N2L914_SALVM